MSKKWEMLSMWCVVITMLFCFTACGSNNDAIVTDNEGSLSITEGVENKQEDNAITKTEPPKQEDDSVTKTDSLKQEDNSATKTDPPSQGNSSASEIAAPNNPVAVTDLKPSEGLEFKSNGDGTCTIIGIGVCTDKDIVIPEKSPNGDMVTSIGKYAFMGIKDVDSVTLVNYAYEIDKNAFQYGEFKTLNIIGGSPAVKESAFSSCEYLTSILFSGCNIKADKYAFYNCGKRADVTFSDCTGAIDKNAFQYGDFINLTFYNCELEIGQSAFSSCEKLASIVFLDSAIKTDEYAFYGCGKDADITFSNCTGFIDERTFQYSDMISLTVSNCELEIEKSAFSSCEELTSIVFTDSTIEAGEYAFYSCGDSAIVEMLHCSLFLDDRAFQYSSLDSLTITGSKVEMGGRVFSGCEDLSAVTIDCDSVVLGEYAFSSCEDLVSVSVCENSKSDNKVKISDRAFQYCKRLKAVTIGNGSIEIGEYVFSNCDDNLIITIAEKQYTANAIKNGLK